MVIIILMDGLLESLIDNESSNLLGFSLQHIEGFLEHQFVLIVFQYLYIHLLGQILLIFFLNLAKFVHDVIIAAD